MFPPALASVARRQVLLGAVSGPLLLAVGGCTQDPPVEPPTDPDREALETAREVEAAALVSVEGWSPGADENAVGPADARAVISAHVAALDEALSATPPATPTPSVSGTDDLGVTVTTDQVVTALDRAAADHTRALRTASPEISPLLASIAASDATLVAAIRRSA